MKRFTQLAFLLLFAICSTNINAQEEPAVESSHSFDMGADLMSRYVWRGLLFSASPNVQPWIEYSYKNFTVGTWGSYATNEYYAEVDLYATYTLGNLSFTVFDYYGQAENDTSIVNDYFNTKNDETAHLLEGTVAYTISDDFPLTITLATFFYGPDFNADGDNNYSTYLELAYPFQIGGTDVNAFIGGTLNEGYYAEEAGLVNIGIQVSKSIPVTEKYSIPLSSSLSMNPSAKEVFLVFGISF